MLLIQQSIIIQVHNCIQFPIYFSYYVQMLYTYAQLTFNPIQYGNKLKQTILKRGNYIIHIGRLNVVCDGQKKIH